VKWGAIREKLNVEIFLQTKSFVKLRIKLTVANPKGVWQENSIYTKLHSANVEEDSIPTSLGRFKPVFSQELEERLVEHVKKLDSLFYGVTLPRPATRCI
jgi:hypothetical protein